MYDLLTIAEDAEAAALGWSLNHVFDPDTGTWLVMVLGKPNAKVAGASVVNQARLGSPLAQKALRLVMTSNQGKK